MELICRTYQNWRIYTLANTELTLDEIVCLTHAPPVETLRHHHRSRVEKKQLNNQYYVVKQPNNKNRSLWIRFTTLYRDSEVLRDLKSLQLLDDLSIPAVQPLAALEQRKYGMVINSTIIYKFKPGIPIASENYGQMILFMQRLHQHGFLHDDPHTKNFLQQDDGDVFLIDCKPRKNLFFKLGVMHNFITLARRSDHPQEIYRRLGECFTDQFEFSWVNRFIELQQFRRRIKNKLRKWLKIQHRRKD